MSDFDITQYIKTQNEAEHAIPGTPVVPPIAPPVAEVKAAEPPPAEVKPAPAAEPPEEGLRRQERRKLRELETANAEMRGRLSAFEEQWKASLAGGKPASAEPPPDPNAKPARTQFATDADFTEALARWASRQETDQARQVREFEQDIQRATIKCREDVTLIPDWAAHQKDLEENGPECNLNEHTVLANLLATSRHQAFVLDYLATNHDELQELIDLKSKPQELIEAFRGLEGHVGRVERQARNAAAKVQKEVEKPPAKEEEKPPAPAKKKLPPPSDAAAPKGGSAPNMDVPTHINGKVNPAWIAKRNAEEASR